MDNILLVENFNPKIADFGFATVNSEKLKNNGKGTPGYAAHKLYYEELYDGIKSFIFSLGVILFNLYIGNAPFQLPLKNNYFYTNIFLGDYPNYWALITYSLEGHEKFIDLINY